MKKVTKRVRSVAQIVSPLPGESYYSGRSGRESQSPGEIAALHAAKKLRELGHTISVRQTYGDAHAVVIHNPRSGREMQIAPFTADGKLMQNASGKRGYLFNGGAGVPGNAALDEAERAGMAAARQTDAFERKGATQTGPRGGRYVITPSGKKWYITGMGRE